MRLLLAVSLLLVNFSSLAVFGSSVCLNSWKSFKTACYYYNASETLSHRNATIKCRSYGAHLTSISSNEEEVFITRWIGSKPLWLGAHQADNVWGWDDQSPFNYKNFAKNLNLSNHCLHLSWNKLWNTVSCSEILSYVCKKKSEYFDYDNASLALEPKKTQRSLFDSFDPNAIAGNKMIMIGLIALGSAIVVACVASVTSFCLSGRKSRHAHVDNSYGRPTNAAYVTPYDNNSQPGMVTKYDNNPHPGMVAPYDNNPHPGMVAPYDNNLHSGMVAPYDNNPHPGMVAPYDNNPHPGMVAPYDNNPHPGMVAPYDNNTHPGMVAPYDNNTQPGMVAPYDNNPQPGMVAPYDNNPHPGMVAPYDNNPHPGMVAPVDSSMMLQREPVMPTAVMSNPPYSQMHPPMGYISDSERVYDTYYEFSDNEF